MLRSVSVSDPASAHSRFKTTLRRLDFHDQIEFPQIREIADSRLISQQFVVARGGAGNLWIIVAFVRYMIAQNHAQQ